MQDVELEPRQSKTRKSGESGVSDVSDEAVGRNFIVRCSTFQCLATYQGNGRWTTAFNQTDLTPPVRIVARL